jgi:uncharacterized MAPEG superfamily protein
MDAAFAGLDAYAHAIAALAAWSLLGIAAIILSAAGTSRQRAPSGAPVRDYTDPMYRRHRALQNMMETNAPFLAGTLAAILAGAAPFWVNLLASVFIVARVAMLLVHAFTENQPARSACWSVGMLCCLGLGGLTLIAALAS